VAWTLYLLECIDGSLYAGITNDLPRRFDMHAAGKGARYTRSHRPLRIVAHQHFPDRSAASAAEYRLKRLDVAGKRAFCRAHPYPD
jgi:putative endonuclease